MTLAKSCHASNMMQDLVKATHISSTKAVLIAMFQLFHYCNLILKLKVATHNKKKLTFVANSFVANFVRYVCA